MIRWMTTPGRRWWQLGALALAIADAIRQRRR
jgi:hypothetical protein